MPNNNFVTFNEFNPLLGASSTSGRSSVPDLTLDTALSSARNFSTTLKRRAYERLDEFGFARSNPQFDSGAAGRIMSSLTNTRAGNDPRIVRGYIRRSAPDAADPTSPFRLYFMYNPETIQRNFVSYLDQQALDPFNTIFGSNNLVAPPGILDFSFELFFDRQVENANGSMPRGVLEDFDYFDLVVRGVVPDPQSPELPDNGVMMINPRNITVVFSPQLSVQGRPNNASVIYEKFDHRMRPIRMRINLSMKVSYIGPVRQDFTFATTKEESTFEATVPYDESVQYTLTTEEVRTERLTLAGEQGLLTGGGGTGSTGGTGQSPLGQIIDLSSASNTEIRLAALQKAITTDQRVAYRQSRPYPLNDNPDVLDCSALVCWAYQRIGCLEAIGQTSPGYGWTGSLMDSAREKGLYIAGPSTLSPLTPAFMAENLQPGDLLIGMPHVAFVVSVDRNRGRVRTFESTPFYNGPRFIEFSYGAITGDPNYHTHVIRPAIAGRDSIGSPNLFRV